MLSNNSLRGVLTIGVVVTAAVIGAHGNRNPVTHQGLLPEIVQAQVIAQSNPLRLQDASQMAPINQALEQSYTGDIQLQSGEAEAAIESVLAGQVDVVSIGRPLTAAEQAKGLMQYLVVREKIAIATPTQNPYQQSLTVEQVNDIFQGNITNWSQFNGNNRPLILINRPVQSNAAQALQRYTRMQALPTGPAPETPADLVAALGDTGVSFFLVSELADYPQLRALPMYGRLPEDPDYPFSQPFVYVYRADNQAAVQPFLAFVESEEGQDAIAKAIRQPQDFPALQAAAPPVASPDNPGSGLDWLPIGIVVLGLGILGVVTLKATQKAHQQKTAPRPAPNYAARIKPTHLTASELGTRDSKPNATKTTQNGETTET